MILNVYDIRIMVQANLVLTLSILDKQYNIVGTVIYSITFAFIKPLNDDSINNSLSTIYHLYF